MASTYVNDLRIEEQATGENSGTWGTKVNSAFSQIAEAFSYGTKQLAADANETFTMPDGTSDGTRSLYLKITSAGSLTATRTVTLGPNTVSKLWIIENATTGSQSITIAQGSGGTVTIPTGAVKMVYSDGAGAGAAVVDALTDVYLASVDHAAFGDNKKAVFGAGSDLQIYHDGTHSKIEDAGTGDLKFITNGSGFNFQKGSTETLANFAIDGAVTLFYDNAAKLATTSTGIDVTGTATAASFETDAGGTFTTASGNDLNIVYPSARSLFIKEGSETHVTVDNAGNVGIGTSSPDTMLHLSDAAGGAVIRLERNDTTIASTDVYGEIQFEGQDASAGSAAGIRGKILGVAEGATGEMALAFQTASGYGSSTERMRIDSSGNVGIGTDSPADALHVLDSSGNAYASVARGTQAQGEVGVRLRGGTSGNDWYIYQKTSSDNLNFYNTADRLTIDSSGNVGIGTASPEALLSLSKTTAGGEGGYIYIDNPATSTLDSKSGIKFGTSAGASFASTPTGEITNVVTDAGSGAAALTFGTFNGTASGERMRIDASGNVGIGVSPGVALDINRATSTASYARVGNGGNVQAYIGVAGDNLPVLGSFTNHDLRMVVNASEVARFDTSGNVGIGIAPIPDSASYAGATLHVHNPSTSASTGSSLRLTNGVNGSTAGTKGFYLSQFSDTNTYFNNREGGQIFYTAGTEAMRIDSDGNVVIGRTAASDTRLHVQDAANRTEGAAHFQITGSGYSAFHWLDGTAYYIGQNSASRALRIYSGAETAGVALTNGATSWSTFSDERLKENIEPVENALQSLSGLRTVKYHLKDVDSPEDKKKIGVIAQDLVGVLDEVIDPAFITGDDTEYMGVRYTELVPVLIKAIQEQQDLIESLTARIAALEGAN